MSERRRGLGRGLGALIPAAPSGADKAAAKAATAVASPSAVPVLVTERGIAAAKVAGLADRETTSVVDIPVSRETDAITPGADQFGVAGAYFAELPIDSITPNPRQPREVFDEDALAELVTSIKEVGLLQPVVVRQTGTSALRTHHGRAPLAGLPGSRSRPRSRRSSGRRTTRSCCWTPCWRTCTAHS